MTRTELITFLEKQFVEHEMMSRFGESAQSKVAREAMGWYQPEEEGEEVEVREELRARGIAEAERFVPSEQPTVRRAVQRGIAPKRLETARDLGKRMSSVVGGIQSGARRRANAGIRHIFG
jgi:hypothetical protein